MYDNNENQNFNNNPYNNINGAGQMQNNMQPQYNNYGQMPNVPQNNGYNNQIVPNQVQENNFFGGMNQPNEYNNQMYNNDNGQEEPPELPPIQPLSSIQAVDVPDMDALSPMNIMPETLPSPGTPDLVGTPIDQPINNATNFDIPVGDMPQNDIQYENSMMQPEVQDFNGMMQPANMPYPENTMQQTNIPNSNGMNQPVNMPYPNNVIPQNDMQYATGITQPTSYPNNDMQTNNNLYSNINQSVNMPYPGNINGQPAGYDVNQVNNMNIPNSSPSQLDLGINNLYNSSSELMSNENQNISQGPTIPQPVYPNINMDMGDVVEEQNLVQQPIQEFEQENSDTSEDSSYNTDISNLLHDIDNSYDSETPDNNVEISDISLAESDINDLEEEQDNSLGNEAEEVSIDNIETMDLDTDNDTDSDGGEAKLLVTNVEKIKELVEEIQSTGVSISLEEFDFEEMYQLIIKINK